MNSVAIDGGRLWDSLMRMAEIGGTAKGGCNRQALSDEDEQGRQLFLQWCRDLGCHIAYDAIGNLFITYPGDGREAPVSMGSHLDTQPSGGRFDGVLGVLAGLEVLRVIHENKISLKSPLQIIVWTNEEGSRFAPAMMGSAVFAENIALAEALATEDEHGISVAAELQRLGYDSPMLERQIPKAYFELHIEQGPILEDTGDSIGIVSGGQAIRWYDLTIEGQETHAGPMPMSMRKDPIPVLAEILQAIFSIAASHPEGRATIGRVAALPGSRNVVPGRVEASVDLRHPQDDILQNMEGELKAAIAALSKSFPEIKVDLRGIWHSPMIRFDEALRGDIKSAVDIFGYRHRDIVSGAGHDAFHVSRVTASAMIFIPCAGGLSHNEEEYASPRDTEVGGNVLLHAVLRAANR